MVKIKVVRILSVFEIADLSHILYFEMERCFALSGRPPLRQRGNVEKIKISHSLLVSVFNVHGIESF
jgi:hypothetical protein